MFCLHCGKEISDQAAFCPFCGQKITTGNAAPKEEAIPAFDNELSWNAPADNAESKNFCRTCGKPIRENAAVCPFCGVPVVRASQTNVWAIIALIISLIPYGGLLGLIFGCIGKKQVAVCHSGEGLSLAAIIIGIIKLVFWVFIIFLAIVLAGFAE